MTDDKKNNIQSIQAKSNANAPSWNAAPLESKRMTSTYVDTSAKQNNVSLNASKNK